MQLLYIKYKNKFVVILHIGNAGNNIIGIKTMENGHMTISQESINKIMGLMPTLRSSSIQERIKILRSAIREFNSIYRTYKSSECKIISRHPIRHNNDQP